MSGLRKAPRRNRMERDRLPEHPFRVSVERRGVYLDGAWRFGRALRSHVGKVVEVRRLPGGQVEIVDDLSLRRIMVGDPVAGKTPNQNEEAA